MKVKIASLIFLEKQSENSMGTESLAHGTKKNPLASRMSDEGISRKSWRTAKKGLGVISTKKPDKSWEWSLPPKKDDPF